MLDHRVGRRHQVQRLAAMAQLPARLLAAAPPQALRLAPQPVARRRFAAVVAVLGQPRLQLLHLRRQLVRSAPATRQSAPSGRRFPREASCPYAIPTAQVCLYRPRQGASAGFFASSGGTVAVRPASKAPDPLLVQATERCVRRSEMAIGAPSSRRGLARRRALVIGALVVLLAAGSGSSGDRPGGRARSRVGSRTGLTVGRTAARYPLVRWSCTLTGVPPSVQ